MERTYKVLVKRENKKNILYPETNAEKAIKNMETLEKRGFKTLAITKSKWNVYCLNLKEMKQWNL